MGRGEEEGGFFDCYLSRSSLSRQIRPQQQKAFTAQETSAIFFCYLLTFSLHFVFTFVLLFSHLYGASFYLCIFSSVFSSLFIAM